MVSIETLRAAREAIGYTYMGGELEDLNMTLEVEKFLTPDGGLLELYDLVIELMEERDGLLGT